MFEELDTFINLHGEYNPVFTYDFPNRNRMDSLAIQIGTIREKLFALGVKKDISHLLSEKLDELEIKKDLLLAYIAQDAKAIDKFNGQLYGEIDPELIELSKRKLQEQFLEPETPGRFLEKEELVDTIGLYLTAN